MRSCRRAANLILLAAFAIPVVAQSLSYQNRGRYSEGTRTLPSTGPAGLDLIAALVEHKEPSATLPAKFYAQFFLPIEEPVDLTIREINPEYFYWLDKVQSDSPWKAGSQNRFEWPTSTVIRPLNLTIDQLGATVRVGRVSPGEVEQVAPAVLYHSRPPEVVKAYRFVFRPSHQMRLQVQVCRGESRNAIDLQEFRSVLAGQTLQVPENAETWEDGWYRLVISGWTLSNNARVDKVVRFYHLRNIVASGRK